MRLFLALELPDTVRDEIHRVQEVLRARCSGWRWVSPEGIHLTLRFLGEVPAEVDATLRESWHRAADASGPVRFRLGGVGVFLRPSNPRVLWLGIRDEEPEGRLASLAATLDEVARAGGLASTERPFRPHLTLARAAKGSHPTAPAGEAIHLSAEVLSAELVLFGSQLLPGGARHTALQRFPMGEARFGVKAP